MKADVSSASPSSERIEELWVVCGLYTEYGATLLVGAWQREKQQNNKKDLQYSFRYLLIKNGNLSEVIFRVHYLSKILQTLSNC